MGRGGDKIKNIYIYIYIYIWTVEFRKGVTEEERIKKNLLALRAWRVDDRSVPSDGRRHDNNAAREQQRRWRWSRQRGRGQSIQRWGRGREEIFRESHRGEELAHRPHGIWGAGNTKILKEKFEIKLLRETHADYLTCLRERQRRRSRRRERKENWSGVIQRCVCVSGKGIARRWKLRDDGKDLSEVRSQSRLWWVWAFIICFLLHCQF